MKKKVVVDDVDVESSGMPILMQLQLTPAEALKKQIMSRETSRSKDIFSSSIYLSP